MFIWVHLTNKFKESKQNCHYPNHLDNTVQVPLIDSKSWCNSEWQIWTPYDPINPIVRHSKPPLPLTQNPDSPFATSCCGALLDQEAIRWKSSALSASASARSAWPALSPQSPFQRGSPRDPSRSQPPDPWQPVCPRSWHPGSARNTVWKDTRKRGDEC